MLHDVTHRAVRYFARALAACALVFAGAAWAQSGEPIKIGYGISQTGGLAPNGKSALLGTGPVADAFLVAFQLVNVIRRLLTEGALNAALVPVWLRRDHGIAQKSQQPRGQRARGDREEGANHARGWCPDCEVRIIFRHPPWRTSESEDTSNLLIQCGFGSEVRMTNSRQR